MVNYCIVTKVRVGSLEIYDIRIEIVNTDMVIVRSAPYCLQIF